VETSSFELFRRRCLGTAPSAATLARGIPGAISLGDSEEALWGAHERAMTAYRALDPTTEHAPAGGGPSLLDLKVELARRLLGPCRLCWLRCPVDRLAGETGACGLGAGLRPYQDFVHVGEELELIPTHAIYLAGCNYRCAYCSDWAHVESVTGDPEVPAADLSRSLEARRHEGALSVSFIGGLPDVNLPGILEAVAGADASVPVVWNSNMSATEEAHRLLEGVVDAYVADLKYGSETCAQSGSAVKGSLAVAQRNLRRVRLEAYVIVRHLVLPDHVDCCAKPALDWLDEHLPGVRVNLMDQYLPVPEVKGTAWDRRPDGAELEAARRHAHGLGLDLAGPGRIATPARRGKPLPSAAAPVADFESTIRIGPDGEVIFENLSPDLAALARDLGDGDSLEDRSEAASPWQ
jgi:putative pyruvate formate lyase activating enzyme